MKFSLVTSCAAGHQWTGGAETPEGNEFAVVNREPITLKCPRCAGPAKGNLYVRVMGESPAGPELVAKGIPSPEELEARTTEPSKPPKFDLISLIQSTGTISGAMEVLVGAVAALLRLRIKPGVDLGEALDALKEDIAAAFNDLPPPPPRGEPSS